jgi:hypothetical protein
LSGKMIMNDELERVKNKVAKRPTFFAVTGNNG